MGLVISSYVKEKPLRRNLKDIANRIDCLLQVDSQHAKAFYPGAFQLKSITSLSAYIVESGMAFVNQTPLHTGWAFRYCKDTFSGQLSACGQAYP
jgi:hypothetical protein